MATVVAVVVIVLGVTSSGSGGAAGHPATVASVTVGAATGSRPIASGFLGLSLEYPAVTAYAGTDPSAVNPVLEQLIRNLAPRQAPVLRIGGDSSDRTWWPVSGAAQPPGVTFSLSPGWMQVTQALSTALGARLILGINLEAGSPTLAGAEAQALLNGLGTGPVQALELGNEPELYGGFAWYHTADGRGVNGRPRSYGFTAFNNDFTNFATALPSVPLAGPTLGGPELFPELGQFLRSQPRVGLVTLHRYPLQLCYLKRSEPGYPTIAHLLSDTASTGLANLFASSVAVAHARGLPLRIDELNTVSCGADPAISQTFASALWGLDTMFEMARVGADGVNMHTFPGAGYELFHFGHSGAGWSASVSPEYYGLMTFARAAPPGARLLATSVPAGGRVKVWATLAPDHRIRVVLINKGTAHSQVLSLRIPAAAGTALLERLRAPSVRAGSGVTLAGQSFGARTATGVLAGTSTATALPPVRGRYVVRLPAASAALLVLGAP